MKVGVKRAHIHCFTHCVLAFYLLSVRRRRRADERQRRHVPRGRLPDRRLVQGAGGRRRSRDTRQTPATGKLWSIPKKLFARFSKMLRSFDVCFAFETSQRLSLTAPQVVILVLAFHGRLATR